VVKVSEISTTHSYTTLVQDPTVRYAKKIKIFKNIHVIIEMKFWSGFWEKKDLGTLES